MINKIGIFGVCMLLIFNAASVRADDLYKNVGILKNCMAEASIENIISPLADATRTFSNGKIRLWHLDTNGEPICCSHHLAILLTEPSGETGERLCKILSMDREDGFYGISLQGIKSKYQPSKGLVLSVPIKLYNTEKMRNVSIEINQQAQSIILSE